MANQPISGLPHNPGPATNDKLELVDVSNTSNQSTGESTYATITELVTGLPSFVAAGSSHAAGLVPDPGSTSHGNPYLLGDDGNFHQVTGGGVSYSGGVYTISGGAGGSPAGSSGQIQINSSGSFGGSDLTTLIDSAFGSTRGAMLYRGSGGWAELSPGTSGYFIKSQGPGADPTYAAVTASAAGSSGQIQTNSSGSFAGSDLTTLIDSAFGSTQGMILYRGASAWAALAVGTNGFTLKTAGSGSNPSWGAPRTPIFSVTGAGSNYTNSTTPTSIFNGATIGLGSLTIPASRFLLGSVLSFNLWGDYDASGSSPTLTLTFTLGGTTVATAVTGVFGTSVTGKQWVFDRCYFGVQAIGASGKICGGANFITYTTAQGADGYAYLTTAGTGTASSQVTIDTTSSLAFDVVATWSAASTSNRFRILGGSAWIDG